MELLQLRYFVAAAELQSMSKAATMLHVSQPTLSGSIIRLETELGVQLFDRVGRSIRLNDKGDLFLQGARRALRDLDAVSETVQAISEQSVGKVALGVFVPFTHAAGCIARFSAENPYASFEINGHIEVAELAKMQTFDVVLYPDTKEFSNINGVPVGEDVLGVIVSEDHPLATRTKVRVSELEDEDFVFMDNSEQANLQMRDLCLQAGFSPTARFVVNSAIAQKQLVEKGLCVGFVRSGYRAEYTEGVRNRFIEIEGDNLGYRIMMGCKRDTLMTQVARSFRNFALEHYGLQANEETLRIFEQAHQEGAVPAALKR